MFSYNINAAHDGRRIFYFLWLCDLTDGCRKQRLHTEHSELFATPGGLGDKPDAADGRVDLNGGKAQVVFIGLNKDIAVFIADLKIVFLDQRIRQHKAVFAPWINVGHLLEAAVEPAYKMAVQIAVEHQAQFLYILGFMEPVFDVIAISTDPQVLVAALFAIADDLVVNRCQLQNASIVSLYIGQEAIVIKQRLLQLFYVDILVTGAVVDDLRHSSSHSLTHHGAGCNDTAGREC